MSRHQKKTGRDMLSYFIEFCGLEGFELRWSAIYVELMYRYIRRITCTYVDKFAMMRGSRRIKIRFSQ